MKENIKIYFAPIEEPRMDFVCAAIQKGVKFLTELFKDSKDSKDVTLYVWAKQDIATYFNESFTQDDIHILTNGKTLVGANLKIKFNSYETFNPSSDVEIIFCAYPNQKMFNEISKAIDKGAVKTVIIVNDEKSSEPWLTDWASNLERIE